VRARGDGGCEHLVVVTIPSYYGHMLRLDDMCKLLQSSADLGCSRSRHKATQHILELLQQYHARTDLDLAAPGKIEDRSARTSRGKCARDNDIGIEDNTHHSGALLTLSADLTNRFVHGSIDLCLGIKPGCRRSLWPEFQDALPTLSAIDVATKRFTEEFAAGTVLFLREPINLRRQIGRKRDGERVGWTHCSSGKNPSY
jgi:hypothetical protein